MTMLMIILFFISGAMALVGEVVWMRMLGLVLGNTIWAASVAVTVWMAGMALGAGVGARIAPRVRSHLRWYALAEGLIGVFYLCSPAVHETLIWIGTTLGDDLGQNLTLGILQRFLVAALVLLLPTFLMGLTLPLLVERMRGVKLAEKVSTLYGVNTVGAATGVFVAAYFLLPRLGEAGSLTAAGSVCLLVASVALLIERPLKEPVGLDPESGGRKGNFSYLFLVSAMGASALAAELIWIRILVLHLGSRVYAFALLLGVYLVGIGLGSLITRVFAARIGEPRSALARLQIATALALGLQVVALGFTGDLLLLLAEVVGISVSFARIQLILIAGTAVLFLPVTLLFGAAFPLAVAADPARRSAGEHAGVVSSANTIGAIFGAAGAPFILVPLIGCQRGLALLVLLHLAVALALRRSRRMITVASAVALLPLLIWIVLPSDWVLQRSQKDSDDDLKIIAIEESLSATVLVKEYSDVHGKWMSLELNGVNVAGSSPSLLSVQQLQGNIPMLLCGNAKRVLHVGFGSGGTCWAVSQYPVEQIDVVEISPEVLSSSDRYFSSINRGVLGDPRVRVILNDGRNYLLATEARYDAILSDSIHPVYAGNGALYTREYFQMCRERLNPGGVVSMWLPLYSLDQESFMRILAAFVEVFPSTTVWYDVSTLNEFTVVAGQVEEGPVSIAWELLEREGVRHSLSYAGVFQPADLVADLLMGPDQAKSFVFDVPPHEDDLPYVEYMAGRTLLREFTWHENLLLVLSSRARQSPFAKPPVPVEAVWLGRDREIRAHLRTLRKVVEGGAKPQ
ncbi:MAG: hypothetical protein GY906_30480 [bacterium]|nr:hypothetical protein [bacterium]